MPGGNAALLLHFGDFKLFRMLDDRKAGRVLKAVMDYAETGALPEGLDAASLMLFTAMRDKVDRDAAHYKAVSERRAEAGKASGKARRKNPVENQGKGTNVHFVQQTGTNANTETETETETESILADAKNAGGGAPAASGQARGGHAVESEPTPTPRPESGGRPSEPVGKPVVAYPTRPEEIVAAANVAGLQCSIEDAKDYLAANEAVGWVSRDGRRIVDWRAGIRGFLTSPYRKLARARLAQMPVAGAKAEMQRRMLEDAAANGQGATEDFT